jgi:hypothetical protein
MVGRQGVTRSFVVSIGLVLLVVGWAVAQDPGAAAAPERQLSGPEQQAEAERVLDSAMTLSKRIQSMLDMARRDRDIIRITCLNDKLTQVNANIGTLEERVANLRDASQSNDTDRRNHEFTVVSVISQKMSLLEQEANQCVGQDIFETGATRIITEVDPASPDEDPSRLADAPDIDLPFIPPPLSPMA